MAILCFQRCSPMFTLFLRPWFFANGKHHAFSGSHGKRVNMGEQVNKSAGGNVRRFWGIGGRDGGAESGRGGKGRGCGPLGALRASGGGVK